MLINEKWLILTTFLINIARFLQLQTLASIRVSPFLCTCRLATYSVVLDCFVVFQQKYEVPCLNTGNITRSPQTVQKGKPQTKNLMMDSCSFAVVLSVYRIVVSCLFQVGFFSVYQTASILTFFISFCIHLEMLFSYVYTHKHVYSQCVYEHMFQ